MESLDQRIVFSNLPIAEVGSGGPQQVIGGFCDSGDVAPAADSPAANVPLDWKTSKIGDLERVIDLLQDVGNQNVYATSGPGSLLAAAGFSDDFYAISEGRILVSVVAKPELADQLASVLVDNNIEITARHEHLIDAWFRPRDLELLAGRDELIFARAGMLPVVFGGTQSA
jgi:hypothetical protein